MSVEIDSLVLRDIRFKPVNPKQSYVGSVVWFPERNHSRSLAEYGDGRVKYDSRRIFLPLTPPGSTKADTVLTKVVENFVGAMGWKPTEQIHVEKITPDLLEDARWRLDRHYKEEQELYLKTNDPLRLEVFKRDYCDAKGNLRDPLWVGIDCNRRGSMLFESRCRQAKLYGLDSLQTDLPIVIADVKDGVLTDEQRILLNYMENSKMEGFKEASTYDILKNVYEFIVTGCKKNSWVEKNMGLVGTKRVIFTSLARFLYWCEVEQEWGLRLWERMDPTNRWLRDDNGMVKIITDSDGKETWVDNPDYIDLRKFNQKVWQGPSAKDHPYFDVPMGQMVDITNDIDKINKERSAKGRSLIARPTGPEGREYVSNWIDFINTGGNKGVTSKIMDRSDIEQVARGCPNLLGRDVAQAIMDRNEAAIAKLSERAFVHNFVRNCDELVYNVLADLVKAIKAGEMTTEQQVEFLNKVLVS